MTLADIEEDILQRAKQKASKIEAEAILKLKERELALNQELKSWKKEREARFKQQAATIQQRIKAEQEAKRKEALLAKKRELISEAIVAAKEKLKKDKNLLSQLLKRAQKEMTVARVYSREKLPGVEWVKQDVDGLIVENKDGSVSMDYTYDTLLADLQERHIQEINEVLFS